MERKKKESDTDMMKNEKIKNKNFTRAGLIWNAPASSPPRSSGMVIDRAMYVRWEEARFFFVLLLRCLTMCTSKKTRRT